MDTSNTEWGCRLLATPRCKPMDLGDTDLYFGCACNLSPCGCYPSLDCVGEVCACGVEIGGSLEDTCTCEDEDPCSWYIPDPSDVCYP